MVFQHLKKPFLEAQDQYLVVIASCLPKKINPKKEPLLAAVCEKYPYADVYSKGKRTPGSYMIVGGENDQQLVLIFSQFYDGKVDFPNDNKNRRLQWFIQALDELSELRGLKSLAFPTQIARDGGGNWSNYYTAIKDFTQTLELKIPLDVKIYENHYGESKSNPSVQTKVSLLNCINLMEHIDLENMYLSKTDIKVVPEKPSLMQRESLVNEVKRTKIRVEQKKTSRLSHLVDEQDHSQDPQFDLISSSSEGGGAKKSPKLKTAPKLSLKRAQGKQQSLQLSDSENISGSEFDEREPSLESDSEPESKAMLEPVIDHDEPIDEMLEDDDYGDLNETADEANNVPQFPQTKKNPDWLDQFHVNCLYQIHPSWREIFERPEIQDMLMIIDKKLTGELEKYGQTTRFLPAYEDIFKAFNLCPFDELKVVLLGQDPYFANTNEAMGLSFSVPEGVAIPPSLRNIFKEIKDTYSDYQMPKSGDLSEWAEQGVLLLNSALTVRHKVRESHMTIWKAFTDKIIEIISKKAEHPVIFMLWGRYAQSKVKLIDTRKHKHLILKATHPSPLGANQGGWFGCKHFDLTNQRLSSLGLDQIDWQT